MQTTSNPGVQKKNKPRRPPPPPPPPPKKKKKPKKKNLNMLIPIPDTNTPKHQFSAKGIPRKSIVIEGSQLLPLPNVTKRVSNFVGLSNNNLGSAWHVAIAERFKLLTYSVEFGFAIIFLMLLQVHFRGYPGNILTPCEGEDSVKWSFINSLKEVRYSISLAVSMMFIFFLENLIENLSFQLSVGLHIIHPFFFHLIMDCLLSLFCYCGATQFSSSYRLNHISFHGYICSYIPSLFSFIKCTLVILVD